MLRRLHRGPVPVQFQKYILRELLGDGPIAQKMPGNAVDHRLVSLYCVRESRQTDFTSSRCGPRCRTRYQELMSLAFLYLFYEGNASCDSKKSKPKESGR